MTITLGPGVLTFTAPGREPVVFKCARMGLTTMEQERAIDTRGVGSIHCTISAVPGTAGMLWVQPPTPRRPPRASARITPPGRRSAVFNGVRAMIGEV